MRPLNEIAWTMGNPGDLGVLRLVVATVRRSLSCNEVRAFGPRHLIVKIHDLPIAEDSDDPHLI